MTQALKQFLASPDRPEGTMTYPELHGFLFAVACSPEPIEPDEWLALIFNDQDAGFANEDEAALILEQIVAAYNEVFEELLEGRPLLPACCQVLQPAMDNFNEDATLAAWSRGFVDGHEWLSEIWESCVPEALDDELGSCLVMLMAFSSTELAKAFCNNSGDAALSLAQLAEMAAESFENAMASYAHIGQTIKQAIKP